MNKLIVVASLGLILAGSLCSAISRADELPAIPVKPSDTKVLILPSLDETGDRAEMQREHVTVATHRLEYEFMTRGFQVLGPTDALRAARAEGVDLDDSDARGSMSLKTLGKDTGADWVVSAAVVEVKDDRRSGFSIFANRRAYAKIQFKVYDMHQLGYIANRFEQQSKTTVRVIPGMNGIGTTGLFKQAIDTTVQRSVDNLLSPYPQNVHVNGEFEENDLLDPNPSAMAPVVATPTTIPASSTIVAPASTDTGATGSSK